MTKSEKIATEVAEIWKKATESLDRAADEFIKAINSGVREAIREIENRLEGGGDSSDAEECIEIPERFKGFKIAPIFSFLVRGDDGIDRTIIRCRKSFEWLGEDSLLVESTVGTYHYDQFGREAVRTGDATWILKDEHGNEIHCIECLPSDTDNP